MSFGRNYDPSPKKSTAILPRSTDEFFNEAVKNNPNLFIDVPGHPDMIVPTAEFKLYNEVRLQNERNLFWGSKAESLFDKDEVQQRLQVEKLNRINEQLKSKH